MCGIAGIFDARAMREPDRELLRRMNQALHHRGPDAGGEHFEPGVALGHRRLSIIDLSGGKQPLFNEDNSVVVTFNGEIYNYAGLVDELTALGHTFRTHSDTEVIVHAWEQWGEQCVRRFNGMFAFVLWDRNSKTLFAARDRLGKKPLFYRWTDDGRFIFASELKALLVDPDCPRKLDPLATVDYFALGYVPDPKCIFTGIHKLPPAHTLTLRQGQERIAQPVEYWDVSFAPNGGSSDAASAEELVARLRDAVKSRLVSEVPLGAFLSGGVDSSAVVAMMAEASAGPVRTCAIAFDHRDYDESAYARMVADRYRTDHHTATVKVDDFDLLDTLPTVYDEPFADSSAIPTYRVCQLARKHVTVALSGDGGDENLAGYRRYRLHMHEERFRRFLPLPLRKAVFGPLGTLYPKLDWAPRYLRGKSTFQGLARSSVEAYFHTVAITTQDFRRSLFSSSLRSAVADYDPVNLFEEHAARSPAGDPLSIAQYIDFKTYLPGDILVKVDRASMAHSLEVRVPFLDYQLVDWISGLSPAQKLRGADGKFILKKALEPYLPNDVLYRQKMGFAVPVAQWFRGPLRERVKADLLGGRLEGTGMFDSATLQKVLREHSSGLRDHSAALWALLMFDRFLASVVR